MATVHALDVSSHSGFINQSAWEEAHRHGWTMAIVQAWGGLPGGGSGPNPYCEAQLQNARLAGDLTAIYIVIPPDTDPLTHELIRVAKAAAGAEYQHLEAVAMDIEDEDRRPLHPDDPDARLADAIANVGDKDVWIYTSLDNWTHIMRGSERFAHYPLWDGRWGPTDGLDDAFVPYGGWTRCAMRQYQRTTLLHGISADLNVASLARLGIAEDPQEELREEVERLRKWREAASIVLTAQAAKAEEIAATLRQVAR